MANKVWVGTDSGNEGDYGTAANWSPSGVPGAGDDVYIPASSTQAITGTLDQSAVAIGKFRVQKGYTKAIGSAALGYLQIDPNDFFFDASGESWIDVGAAAIPLSVISAPRAQPGSRGLYVKGSAITTLSVLSGSVGLAFGTGETSTATSVYAMGSTADVIVGAGATVTNGRAYSGTLKTLAALTLAELFAGELLTDGDAAGLTACNVFGGKATLSAAGTIAALVLRGGQVDMLQSSVARTISSLTQHAGSEFLYDPDVVTITAQAAPDTPVRITTSRI